MVLIVDSSLHCTAPRRLPPWHSSCSRPSELSRAAVRGINKKREENRERIATFRFGKVLFGHTFPQVGPKSKKIVSKVLISIAKFYRYRVMDLFGWLVR